MASETLTSLTRHVRVILAASHHKTVRDILDLQIEGHLREDRVDPGITTTSDPDQKATSLLKLHVSRVEVLCPCFNRERSRCDPRRYPNPATAVAVASWPRYQRRAGRRVQRSACRCGAGLNMFTIDGQAKPWN